MKGKIIKNYFITLLLLTVAAFVYSEQIENVTKSVCSPGSAKESEFLQSITATELELPIETEIKLYENVKMIFVLIPAGEFNMGSPSSEKGRTPDEGPVHHVTISKPFYMGKYEVTQKQFRSVTGTYKECKFAGDGLPVENVNWYEINSFLNRLSNNYELKFRLPTEAEWEYACRAGTTTPFYTGDTINGEQANFKSNIVYNGSEKGVYLKMTTQVGTYPPNAFGLHDMHGNVCEWCSDWYGNSYYSTSESIDPQGPVNGQGHVIRGGSWNNPPDQLRSANRRAKMNGADKKYLGFRVVLEIPDGGDKEKNHKLRAALGNELSSSNDIPGGKLKTTVSIEHELVYDEKTKKGHITIKGRGLEARPWMMKKIGDVCTSKNILMQDGVTPEPGYFRVLNEILKDGTYTIEFEAVR